MPGIIRSVSTTSTGSARRSSSAAGPVPARRKRQPSRAKMRSRESRLACSSSTPRTVPCMDGLYCAAGMPTALIGPDGFIGKNLEAQAHFDEKTDGALRPGRYDLVVCAGAPGEKWKANRDPEDDAAAIRRLIESLREVQTGKFVLISTVDVYPRAPPALYDLRSKHAPLWGGQPFGCLYAKDRMLQEIADFVEKERAL